MWGWGVSSRGGINVGRPLGGDELAGADNVLDLFSVERLILKQRVGDEVELVAVFLNKALG
ncbi:MAG: hypothetical protein Ct9H300mP32_4110 [Verrucomicrobiota bacterium]|nr:MAG: hypothetical protein Ct9H300mP32_4110 [Verrucomicrobiota bacterium]